MQMMHRTPSRTRKRVLILVALWLIGMAGSAAAEVELGMNYSWWRFALKSPAECKARPASVFHGNWIVDQYHSPEVRQTVRDQLRAMRAGGFTRLRTLIFHRRPINDQLSGALLSATGDLSPRDRKNIGEFVGDIARAGYRGLEIGFGFVEQNSLFCRKQDWGDCFEPARIEENWRFISQIADTANAAAGAMTLRFDLQNEGCPAPSMRAAAVRNAAHYLTTIAARFQARFGPIWLISCADSPRAQRATLMADQLGQAALSPRFIEIHTYRTDAARVFEALDGADALAQRLDASLILGEMRYHSAEQNAIVRDWLQRRPRSRLREVYQWPLRDPSSKCHMDSGPPFSP
jgi:hypothetical protein